MSRGKKHSDTHTHTDKDYGGKIDFTSSYAQLISLLYSINWDVEGNNRKSSKVDGIWASKNKQKVWD